MILLLTISKNHIESYVGLSHCPEVSKAATEPNGASQASCWFIISSRERLNAHVSYCTIHLEFWLRPAAAWKEKLSNLSMHRDILRNETQTHTHTCIHKLNMLISKQPKSELNCTVKCYGRFAI